MASLNRCTFIGNVGADPDIKSMNSGDRVANFSLACTETWKDKNSGEKKERTEWVRVVVWNEGLLKVVENYVKKDSQLYIEGAMQTRKWTDNAGVEKYSTEIVLQKFQGTIVLLGGKRDDAGSSGGSGSSGGGYQAATSGGGGGSAYLDDDVPFVSSDSIW